MTNLEKSANAYARCKAPLSGAARRKFKRVVKGICKTRRCGQKWAQKQIRTHSKMIRLCKRLATASAV